MVPGRAFMVTFSLLLLLLFFKIGLKILLPRKNPKGYTGEPKTKACSKRITLERTAGAEPNTKQSANLSIVFVARGMNYLKFTDIQGAVW